MEMRNFTIYSMKIILNRLTFCYLSLLFIIFIIKYFGLLNSALRLTEFYNEITLIFRSVIIMEESFLVDLL
jgi:hypothetical protein